MAFHRTFLIGNLTLEPRLSFSQAFFSILGVTFRVFFLILFSLKKNNNKWRLQIVFKMVFSKIQKRVSPLSGKRIIAKMRCGVQKMMTPLVIVLEGQA